MNRQFLKDGFVWGFILWLIGYVLGIVLYPIVPHTTIGWIIMPFGIIIALWVLLRKIHAGGFLYYTLVGFAWVIIAIISDYFFLVKLFKPIDDYYKLDVYLYYILTFTLPILIGLKNYLR